MTLETLENRDQWDPWVCLGLLDLLGKEVVQVSMEREESRGHQEIRVFLVFQVCQVYRVKKAIGVPLVHQVNQAVWGLMESRVITESPGLLERLVKWVLEVSLVPGVDQVLLAFLVSQVMTVLSALKATWVQWGHQEHPARQDLRGKWDRQAQGAL